MAGVCADFHVFLEISLVVQIINLTLGVNYSDSRSRTRLDMTGLVALRFSMEYVVVHSFTHSNDSAQV